MKNKKTSSVGNPQSSAESQTRREFLTKILSGAAGAGLAAKAFAADNLTAHDFSAANISADSYLKPIHRLTPKPPLGWNSFDSYGLHISQEEALKNLDVFAKRLKPAGYEYFVIDAGWYSEYTLVPGTTNPTTKNPFDNNIDEYGRFIPSKTYFSNGIKPLADRAHRLGVKFGIHIMRGIPRKAVKLNTPVWGTKYRAQDIADINSICPWSDLNYGLDMTKPGAQEYYDSWIKMLADWGVDFIKADDITKYPAEIEAVARAIAKTGRPIVLSLSPGGNTDRSRINAYIESNMLRTTKDIWDNRQSLDRAFAAWKLWNDYEAPPGFWLDLDMIPFGHLLIKFGTPAANGQESALMGEGRERMSQLTTEQKCTFITMRALAASPLFMGGDLPTSDELSFELITNPEMLRCNQNGVRGKQTYAADNIEVWHTPETGKPANGWLGIFNRNTAAKSVNLTAGQMGLAGIKKLKLRDVWKNRELKTADGIKFDIGADGVIFLRYGGSK